MRWVLFDEDVPRPLRRNLPGFDIQTVVEAGWAGTKNGELLRLAQTRFDVFLTADRNLPFQQNIAQLTLGVVVLALGTTKLDELIPHAASIIAAIDSVQPGSVELIEVFQPDSD